MVCSLLPKDLTLRPYQHRVIILKTLSPKQSMYRNSGSEEEGFKGFGHNVHGGHLGHVTETIFTNSCNPFPRRLHENFGLD